MKKRSLQKALALAVAAVMALGTLAGCGSSSTTEFRSRRNHGRKFCRKHGGDHSRNGSGIHRGGSCGRRRNGQLGALRRECNPAGSGL